jgi:monovalent cation:H+ antiporter-2, CPA2 family
MLVIATPDTFRARKMIEIALMLNPRIDTVVRTHSEEEAALLEKEHAGKVFMGEHELALAMARHVLEKVADATGTPAGR